MAKIIKSFKEYISKLRRDKNDKLPDSDTTDHMETSLRDPYK